MKTELIYNDIVHIDTCSSEIHLVLSKFNILTQGTFHITSQQCQRCLVNPFIIGNNGHKMCTSTLHVSLTSCRIEMSRRRVWVNA